jgi:hypothetical protein
LKYFHFDLKFVESIAACEEPLVNEPIIAHCIPS